MANPLDTMAWNIAASALLLGIAALRLPYKASSDSVEEKGKSLRIGLAITLGASGFYLFLSGIFIHYLGGAGTFPGNYSVLFGGAAAFGGLTLVATSIALYLNQGLKTVSYIAFVVGLLLVVDAYSIWIDYGLTRTPDLAGLAYLSAAVPSFLSVFATHTDNKWLRWIFALFAFIFALAWGYEAAEFTHGHLEPPVTT